MKRTAALENDFLQEILAKIRLVREGLQTHINLQRAFNKKIFGRRPTIRFEADTRLDGVRECYQMIMGIEADFEEHVMR